MARKLRIAVTVFFGLLTVALVVLWVRSYWRNEIVSRVDTASVATTVGWNNGTLYFIRRQYSPAPPSRGRTWWGRPRAWQYSGGEASRMTNRWQLGGPAGIVLPIWVLVSIAAAGTYLPYSIRRFSLRALFVATALVAVVLGLGVWLAS